jgi:heme/copper-type cytochrome/quinol oxidase subunit 2
MTRYLTATGSAVFLVVVGFLLYAVWRGHRREESASGPDTERRLTRWVAGAVGVTTAILLATLLYNFYTGRALARFADPGALTVRSTAGACRRRTRSTCPWGARCGWRCGQAT